MDPPTESDLAMRRLWRAHYIEGGGRAAVYQYRCTCAGRPLARAWPCCRYRCCVACHTNLKQYIFHDGQLLEAPCGT